MLASLGSHSLMLASEEKERHAHRRRENQDGRRARQCGELKL
jgi:hypothetical protein